MLCYAEAKLEGNTQGAEEAQDIRAKGQSSGIVSHEPDYGKSAKSIRPGFRSYAAVVQGGVIPISVMCQLFQ